MQTYSKVPISTSLWNHALCVRVHSDNWGLETCSLAVQMSGSEDVALSSVLTRRTLPCIARIRDFLPALSFLFIYLSPRRGLCEVHGQS
jgi:hypothetical protein